ncbi:hypothetical protein CONPUDRAFT_150776 [Coniophora puteana RWD-64-598 SS2]|uniref:Uncharacterized protein n=1 Tax=Coniophora puteana (strain RWD-64-598) TaxID=741705 RepID=A0A5M3MX41_CONPW|nr:uncharacterized protein CONPUDRAFT_150776 [Coniophora puteana RWD-64-598 SS2]EIW83709.1 hypothetical protein CONPUDRAFT_150776 [Coniophora puteana RWD-64-598 SS2]
MAARANPIISATTTSTRALHIASSPMLSPKLFGPSGARAALEGAARGHAHHASPHESPSSPQIPMRQRSLSFGPSHSPPATGPLVPLLDTRTLRPLRNQHPITRPPAALLGRPKAASSLYRPPYVSDELADPQNAVDSAYKIIAATANGGTVGSYSGKFFSPIATQMVCPPPPSTPEPAVIRGSGFSTRRRSAHPGRMDLSSIAKAQLDVRFARVAPFGYDADATIPQSVSVGLGLGASAGQDASWGPESDLGLGLGAGLGLGISSAAYTGQSRRSVSMPRLRSREGNRRASPIEEELTHAGDNQLSPEWSTESPSYLSSATQEHQLPPSASMPTPPPEQDNVPTGAKAVLKPTLPAFSPSPLVIGSPAFQTLGATATTIMGADGGALTEGRTLSNPYFPRAAAPAL